MASVLHSIQRSSEFMVNCNRCKSANQSTLESYGEGTWIPTLKFGGVSVGLMYSYLSARWTKIGRLVFYEIDITVNAVGTSMDLATITGLLFTANSAVSGPGSISVVMLTLDSSYYSFEWGFAIAIATPLKENWMQWIEN